MRESPFTEFRHLVLGSYRTAAYLRQFILTLSDGLQHPIGLSYLAAMDVDHFNVCMEMLRAFHENGPTDPLFCNLVKEVTQKLASQTPEERKHESFERWLNDVEVLYSRSGISASAIDAETEAHLKWYEDLFTAGAPPQQAVNWTLSRFTTGYVAVG